MICSTNNEGIILFALRGDLCNIKRFDNSIQFSAKVQRTVDDHILLRVEKEALKVNLVKFISRCHKTQSISLLDRSATSRVKV